MNKTSTTIILVLLIIVVVGAIFFLSQDKETEAPLETTNGLDGEEEPEPEESDLEEPESFTFQDNYQFSMIVSQDDSETNIELNKINDLEYEFHLVMLKPIHTEEELNQSFAIHSMTMMLTPIMYSQMLNKDFSEFFYDFAKEQGETDGTQGETFEEFYNLQRAQYLEEFETDPDFADSLEIQEHYSVMKEMFEEGIEFRDISFSIDVVYETENDSVIYTVGEFVYDGTEKQFYNNICDLEQNCYSVFGVEDEWISFERYVEIIENPPQQ